MTRLAKIQRFESKVQPPPWVFHLPRLGDENYSYWRRYVGKRSFQSNTNDTRNRIDGTTNFSPGGTLANGKCLRWLERKSSSERAKSSIRGRCSVLAKLKTGWKLMGVRTVVAKYLHAGPGISIKVNPPSFEEARSSLPGSPFSSFDRGKGIFFAVKSRGVCPRRARFRRHRSNFPLISIAVNV